MDLRSILFWEKKGLDRMYSTNFMQRNFQRLFLAKSWKITIGFVLKVCTLSYSVATSLVKIKNKIRTSAILTKEKQ